MLEPLISGLLLGILITFLIGATFFVLIETSLSKGFKKALVMNTGVFTGDILILTAAYFLAAGLLETILVSNYFKIGSSIFFIGFGFLYIFKNNRQQQPDRPVRNSNNFRLFIQGVLVNILNPSVSAFWLGAMVYAISNQKYSSSQLLTYFLSAMITLIICDILKIYFASKLKNVIKPSFLRKIYLITGIILALFGIKILFGL